MSWVGVCWMASCRCVCLTRDGQVTWLPGVVGCMDSQRRRSKKTKRNWIIRGYVNAVSGSAPAAPTGLKKVSSNRRHARNNSLLSSSSLQSCPQWLLLAVCDSEAQCSPERPPGTGRRSSVPKVRKGRGDSPSNNALFLRPAYYVVRYLLTYPYPTAKQW
ncbi:hypothetical protein EDB81DRAFT_39370 [Dactylonectria macrodidyma]|uniref:Secreted protein n=1 Tax=Dactylonectria macrodidyma TaxID=307937 RepID=A0A9P9FST8_9HYPO|nr:hypothetical protein EDB81DRAFT_39370 [Dactylonectria macrodidyma]